MAERNEQGEYLGANGTKLAIHPGSGQFKARPGWIVSAEQVQTTKVYARNVARIDPQWVEEVGAHLVKRNTTNHTGNAAPRVPRSTNASRCSGSR